MVQGNLTIDASNAGVILDGSNMPDEYAAALEMYSNGNTVWGLQLLNFSPGVGIALAGGVQNNTVGGDRSIGSGPLGRGNLVGKGGLGISLVGANTSFNIVTGNLIGTDPAGAENWGNEGSGIWLSDGASRNTIGPGNVIAYGRVYGVEILDSVGNTIVQNSIHDNARGGIYLWKGANAGLPAPAIFDFDLTEGTLTGTARPNATVEVFSDSGDQGRVYEGKTMADSTGWFAFRKGTAFAGPHLTGTATDTEGNTSVFSVPTTGNRRYVILQQGNNLPKSQLQTKPSRELLDNRMGDFMSLRNFDESAAASYIGWITRFGYKWVYLSFDWNDFTQVLETGDYSTFEIRPVQNNLITDLVKNGISVIYSLNYYEPVQVDVPFSWANLDAYMVKDLNTEGRFRTEEEITRYLDYVRFLVRNLKDRVKYYQILNEPFNGIKGQYVRSEDYINLVKRVIPVIRDENPDAKIVVGSVFGLPNEPGCYDYLLNILKSDIMPLVDGISFHPSPDLSPEYDPAYYLGVSNDINDIKEGYQKYYDQTIEEIKQVATSHGFKGEFISEGPTFAPQPYPPQTHYYSDIKHAKYTSRSIIMNLFKNITVMLPLGDWNLIPSTERVVQNLCNIMAGAKTVRVKIEIESPAKNIKSHGFFLPNGDRLLALWTDGVAVDDDPGIEATVTIPGITAKKVTGIDVLHGFEQQLTTNFESGNLAISGLRVKDYPLLLRISP